MIEELIISKLEKIEQLSMLAAKNVLTLDDAHSLTGISKSTLYKMTSKKEIPHSKRGNTLYFDRKELENWMLENRVKTVKECEQEASRAIVSQRMKGRKKVKA